MPGFEYDTIINKVDGVGQKIDDEVVNKKFTTGDINPPANDMTAALIPVLGMFASAGAGTMLLPMPGNPLNTVAFQAVGSLRDALTAVQSGANGIQAASSSIVSGGIRGLLNFGKVVLPLVGKLVAVVAAIGVVCFEVWYTFDQIGQSVSGLYEAKAELEVKVGSQDAKIEKLIADNTILKQGLINLENSLNTKIQEQATKIENLELEMSNLQQLIQSNHTETKGLLNSVNNSVSATTTKIDNLAVDTNNGIGLITRDIGALNSTFSPKLTAIDSKLTTMDEFAQEKWSNNTWWQENNRSAVTATLTAAAIEAPNRPLDKTLKATESTKETVKLALEGTPPQAAADPDYTAAIAAGTAVAAGTVGYAGFKNRNFLKGKIKLAMNMIDFNLVVNSLNLLFSLQTAMQISKDIVETSTTLLDTAISVFMNTAGLKNVDEDPIDFSKKLKDGFNIIMTNLVGAETWAEIYARFTRLNNIFRAGNQLLWSMREMSDITGSLAARSCDFVAQLANAFKSEGMIRPNFPWLSENNYRQGRTGEKMTQALENIQNTVSVFNSLLTEVEEGQQVAMQIAENNEKLQQTLTKSPLKDIPEHELVKAREETAPQ